MVKRMLPFYDAKKYPSYLKGLVNDYARSLGDIERLSNLRDSVDAELSRAAALAESCERLIRHYDERLDPTGVTPVRAWRNKYGDRGALQNAVADELRNAYPSELSSTELKWLIIAKFKLDFPTWVERKTWSKNSLGNALKQMLDRGLVERLHDPEASDGTAGRWRWFDPEGVVDSGEAMAALATAAGVEVDNEPASPVR